MNLKDKAKISEDPFILNVPSVHDHNLSWHAKWKIRKWDSQDKFDKNELPDNIVDFEPNGLLNEGINELFTVLCSSGGTKFDNSNANLGVGDSSTAFVATQTGLQASTNKLYKAMDATFPTYGTSQQAIWQSTFQSADANFAWNEFTVSNTNSDTGKNLNRLVSSQGTKISGQVWQLTLTITLS